MVPGRMSCFASRPEAAAQVVLAADVLYDDTLTAAFCSFLEAFLRAARTAHASCAGHARGPAKSDPTSPSCARAAAPVNSQRAAADDAVHSGSGAVQQPHACGAPAQAERAEQAAAAQGGAVVPVEAPLVLLAAERRFVFTMDDADVRAPAFEYFLRHVRLVQEHEPGSLAGPPCAWGPPAWTARTARLKGADGAAAEAPDLWNGLVGRTVDWRMVPRALGGAHRSNGLVLLQLWLAD
eukprot:jgi/Ulvmu1/10845/UM007_0019.1